MAVGFEAVTDVEGARRWNALDARATPIDHPGLVGDPIEGTVHLVMGEHPAERPLLFLATDGGEDVGHGFLGLPLLDNLDNSYVLAIVDPAHRRRGIGASFASFLLDVARSEGRKRAVGFVGSPLDAESPGAVLARNLGAEPALEMLRRQLDLAGIDDETHEALVREHIGAHAAGYELVTWIDRMPEQLVDDGARLMGRMSTDVPLGDLDVEPEVWDAARYRDREEDALASGLQRLAAGAIERSTGRLVAYTDVGVSPSAPSVSYQWDTIVDPDHRGHRLGLLVKVANLRELRRRWPAAVSLQTWNAASNAHMVAINEMLGFRAVERSTHWQLAL